MTISDDDTPSGEDGGDLARVMSPSEGGGRSGDEDHAPGELMSGLPFAAALGIRLISATDGEASAAIPYDPRLIGDPSTGVLHGGVITALLDTVAGAAVMSSPTRPLTAATLDLRIDYMRPARPGAMVWGCARCYREGALITFVSAVAHDGDRDDPIAAAHGAFAAEARARPDAARRPAARRGAQGARGGES